MSFLPISRMQERVKLDASDSDVSLFSVLMLYAEMVFKTIVAGMTAAILDDRDRHRYRQVHRLIRASGLGEWQQSLDEMLTGPPSQFLTSQSRDARRELVQKVAHDAWQFDASFSLQTCLKTLGIESEQMGAKVTLRRWFIDFVLLRNKTRAHGAIKQTKLADVCQPLQHSIELIAGNYSLFSHPWAVIRRNLSGKYRVTPFGDDDSVFTPLRPRTSVT